MSEETMQTKTDLTYEAPFANKVSRLFIFRFLWMFIEVWVLYIWGIWYGLVSFVQFWYMLILGKRSEGLWKKQMRFMRHMSKWMSYLHAMTDRRPDFIEQ
jgi:hypothetical protein